MPNLCKNRNQFELNALGHNEQVGKNEKKCLKKCGKEMLHMAKMQIV